MKFKVSQCIIPLICFYLVAELHCLERALESTLRIFRLITIPALFIFYIILIRKKRFSNFKKLGFLELPIIILFLINLIQLFIIPKDAIEMHITGSVKFTAWFGLYLTSLLSLNLSSALKYKMVLLNTLATIFLIGIAIYPFIIITSGTTLSSVLTGYGDTADRIQNSGLFGSANEDANGLMTLLPFALLFVEKIKGVHKSILRYSLFIFFPFLLIYNGTRTTLFFTLPITLILFYSELSLKGLLKLILILLTPLIIIFPFISSFLNQAFSAQLAGDGGSFTWRVENVWNPAIEYTQRYSPIFGFGSRGWEYIANPLDLFTRGGIQSGNLISPHSGYVWAFVSWGGIGLCMYLLFLIILLAESFKISQLHNKHLAMLGRALFCSVFSYCTWSYISNVMWAQGWIILVTIAILIASAKVIPSVESKDTKYLD